MTVRIRTEHRFERSAEELIELFTDPDFQDAKVRAIGESGSKLVSLDHDPEADELVVVTRQRIARDDLPGIARRFARDPVLADREERWNLSPIWCTGEFDVDVADAPMRSGGEISLLSDGDDACILKVRTFISVSAPLVSRGIERGMAENVEDWLDDEYRFTLRWLEKAGGG